MRDNNKNEIADMLTSGNFSRTLEGLNLAIKAYKQYNPAQTAGTKHSTRLDIASMLSDTNPSKVIEGLGLAIKMYDKPQDASTGIPNGRTFHTAFEHGTMTHPSPETPAAGA